MSQAVSSLAESLGQLTAPGAPFEVNTDSTGVLYYSSAPKTLIEALEGSRAFADQEFLVYEGERWSFNDMFVKADQIAALLVQRGVGKGDRVALAMRNYPEWMAIFIATTSIGAVIVPLNSWGQANDLTFAITDAGARMVFCDQQRFTALADTLAAADIDAVLVRPTEQGHKQDLDTLLASGRTIPLPTAKMEGNDLVMIMYTSGTTGKPKGAASTHAALCQAMYNFECNAMASAMCNPDAIGAMLERGYAPTALLAVPLFHVSGCHAQFLAALRGGRRIVMMYKWDVDKALDYIEQEHITSVAAAPSMILDLLESPHYETTDTSSLFSFGTGGAATPPKAIELMNARLPGHFSGTGWGMTETNAQGASLTGERFVQNPGSAGPPHPIVALDIRNDAGQSLTSGDPGEIWIRSSCNIRQYWNRPDANATDFSAGWFKTGDIGYLDADGYLYLSDRAKDMVIRGGENIYPVEIENALLDMPAIAEVAAIGLPHERLGEELAVVVRVRDGYHLSAEQLIEFATDKLARYKVPTRIFFTEEPLPRNATSKVLKPQVKATLLEDGYTAA